MIEAAEVVLYGGPLKKQPLEDEKPSCGHPMYYEKNRLNSFVGWPVRCIEPSLLARAGFFFTHKEDVVRCPFCNLEIYQWHQDDVPLVDHRKYSPLCPFVRNLPCGNIPMSSDDKDEQEDDCNGFDTCGKYGIQLRPNSFPESEAPERDLLKLTTPKDPPAHIKYSTLESRLATYEDWPVAMKQKPAELAEAGFYYMGKGDQVVCFHCNGGLKNWVEEDVPWEQHARWYSKCSFLRTVKSPEYIESVCNQLPEALVKPDDAESLNVAGTSVSTVKTSSAGDDDESTKELGKEAPMCKICFQKEVGIVFLPCRHMVACVDCAPFLDTCAVCRKPLQATLRAFLS